MPCQVPKTSFPFDIGIVMELPINEVLRCETESLGISKIGSFPLTRVPRLYAAMEETREQWCQGCMVSVTWAE
jgi:hypothetical protein